MPRTQIDDASAAEASTDTAGDLPGFEEFFPRQASGAADGARNAMEMRVVRKPTKIVAGETGLR